MFEVWIETQDGKVHKFKEIYRFDCGYEKFTFHCFRGSEPLWFRIEDIKIISIYREN